MGGDRLSTVLLIGANGFLGTQVARRLLRRDDCRIIAMVRAKDRQSARQRLLRSWWDWPELVQSLDTVTEVTHGDITMRNFGLTQAEYESLVGSVTHIIHTAADLRLNAPIRELRKSNVEGTGTVLRFAREVKADHGLSRLAHVSTAYVAGARTGKIAEDSLSDEEGFNSNYELSKYEGEILVKASRPELPVSVFRPGMVVGDSLTGEIKTFNTLYFPLRLYLTSRSRFLPLHPSLRVNMVPVDYVSEAIARLTFYPRAEGLNFHLTAPESSQPTLREFVEFVRNWAVERMNLRLPRPFFLPIPHSKEGRVRASGPSANETRSEDSFAVLRPYFYERREYQRDNIDGLLGPYDLKWQEFLPKLLDFAVYMGFMHKSERTVHEQMLFRLSGRRRPVTFFDVVQGKALEKGAGEMRRDIVRAASALSKLGVGKGDRVALVGRNSTRYLTVDVAIGLAGAVSVPLYYTSPPSEIDEIVSASGSL
ncbi:MAG: AMP-binding protein, partial [Euryarchaeota archaeon]|nr:AMP-binding protein [Euryarchaeota archaeon]